MINWIDFQVTFNGYTCVSFNNLSKTFNEKMKHYIIILTFIRFKGDQNYLFLCLILSYVEIIIDMSYY